MVAEHNVNNNLRAINNQKELTSLYILLTCEQNLVRRVWRTAAGRTKKKLPLKEINKWWHKQMMSEYDIISVLYLKGWSQGPTELAGSVWQELGTFIKPGRKIKSVAYMGRDYD